MKPVKNSIHTAISALIPFVWWLPEDWAIETRVIFKMCISFQVPPSLLVLSLAYIQLAVKDVLRVTILSVSFIENKLMLYLDGQRDL